MESVGQKEQVGKAATRKGARDYASADEIAAMVMRDHADIRAQMWRVRRKIEAYLGAPDTSFLDDARHEMLSLIEMVRAHLRLEDMLLPPLLGLDFAWGEIRTRNLLEHHAEQRRTLRRLQSALSDPRTERAALREMMERFTVELEVDMREEERTLLAEAVANDEIVTVEIGA